MFVEFSPRESAAKIPALRLLPVWTPPHAGSARSPFPARATTVMDRRRTIPRTIVVAQYAI